MSDTARERRSHREPGPEPRALANRSNTAGPGGVADPDGLQEGDAQNEAPGIRPHQECAPERSASARPDREMTTSGTIVLVVPCYNEADRLQCAAFRACAKRIPLVRFVFVDDGSTDGTLRILEGLRRHDPDAFAIHRLDSNRGKAEAVRVGILEALNEDPSLVGFWDADLATPLDELERFLEKFGENPALEMVFGSRVKLLGRHIRRNPARHYIGRVFATTVAALLGIPIYDSQCGAKLFRVTEGFRELFSEPFVSRWIFDVEILARAMKRRRREQAAPLTQVVHEQPLMQWRDVRGSKIRVRDSLVVGLDLLRIYWKYLRA